jgi:hypothetical protein
MGEFFSEQYSTPYRFPLALFFPLPETRQTAVTLYIEKEGVYRGQENKQSKE